MSYRVSKNEDLAPLISPADLSPSVSVTEWLCVALACVGPIGLLVLRRQLGDARGGMLVLKRALIGFSALTAPLAAGLILVVMAGIYEDADQLLSLLMAAW